MAYERFIRSIGRGCVPAIAVLAALLWATAGPAPRIEAQSRGGPMTDGTVTFGYTGAAQQWTVPPGVTQATFDLYGAQGGSGYNLGFAFPGGTGGRATATLPLTPGDTITIMVGGKGRDYDNSPNSGFACSGRQPQGGFNGGADSGDSDCGQGGGGASDVRIGGTDLAHRMLVAGGGGGASINFVCNHAGAGGGLTGGSADCDGGGSGGNQTGSSGSGQLGFGGKGATCPGLLCVIGGGGGGGYYGGGGGGHGLGGGGGSGFGPAGTDFQNGVREGHGGIIISFLAGPVLTGLNPNGGPVAGGTVVTLTGLNLTSIAATAVDFGGRVATNVHCASATTCTATSPAGTGTVNVTVVNDHGTSNALPFTYIAGPTLTSLSPSSGPGAGGTTVTIVGAGFIPRQTSVQFGTVPATGVSCSSTTQCTAVSPAGSGTVNVVVETPGGISSAQPFTYIAPPTLTNVSPNVGPAAGGAGVTLSGANLNSPQVIVAFGSAPATNVHCSSATTCTATSPAGMGTVNVTVTTPGGTSNALPYTYVGKPVLTSLSPSAGPAAGGTVVTLNGTNLGGSSIFVTFGSQRATQVSCARSTLCTATSPPGSGTVDVLFENAGGFSNALSFTYRDAPTLTSLSPVQGPAAGGTVVTIQGSGFSPAGGATTVTFGGAAATNVSCSSSTQCSATSPPGQGAVDVRVTVGGQSSAPNPQARFTYQPPLAPPGPGRPPPAAVQGR
jgi:hypothetical protein